MHVGKVDRLFLSGGRGQDAVGRRLVIFAAEAVAAHVGEVGVAAELTPDEEWQAVRREFSEEEVAKLTLAIAMINLWNRIAVSFRSTPGAKPGN